MKVLGTRRGRDEAGNSVKKQGLVEKSGHKTGKHPHSTKNEETSIFFSVENELIKALNLEITGTVVVEEG